jgi:Ca2+-binding EF-hand superfamily protein
LGVEEAPTKELDALYDSLDVDGSGELDLDEMKQALERLKDDLSSALARRAKYQVFAHRRRKVANAITEAIEATEIYEEERAKLDTLKRGTAAARLGMLLKNKSMKVSELVAQWDTDGNNRIDLDEFRTKARALGLEGTQDELAECFAELDVAGHGSLGLQDMTLAFKKLMTASLDYKKREYGQEKAVKKAQAFAQSVQMSTDDFAALCDEKDIAEGRVVQSVRDASEEEAVDDSEQQD